jgi:hypothetical protein
MSMPAIVCNTSPNKIRAEFDRTWPWLDASIARYGRTHNKEHLWEEIASKRVCFFTTAKSAAICRLVQFPTGLKSLHIWLVGGNLNDIKTELYPRLEQWAKKAGCHRMQAVGRKGWIRALDGWMPQGQARVKSLMSNAGTAMQLKILGYTEIDDS